MTSKAFHLLPEHGISPTPQRVAIHDALQGRKDHPTVDKVFAELRESMPTLSKTTVYSTLQLFAQHGLILALHAEDGELRYDPTTHFHAHFKCRACGDLRDIELPGREKTAIAPLPRGFVPETQELVYYGLCPHCSHA